jgi:hypothetical protein
MQRVLFRGTASALLWKGTTRFLLRHSVCWGVTSESWLRLFGHVLSVFVAGWLLLLLSGEFTAACLEALIQVLAYAGSRAQSSGVEGCPSESEGTPLGQSLIRRIAKAARIPVFLGSIARFRVGFGTRIALCWGATSSKTWVAVDEQALRATSIDACALIGNRTMASPTNTGLTPDWMPQLHCVHEQNQNTPLHHSRRPCFGIGLSVPFIHFVVATDVSPLNDPSAEPLPSRSLITVQMEKLYLPLTAILAIIGRYFCQILHRKVENTATRSLLRSSRSRLSTSTRALSQRLLGLLIRLFDSFATGIRAAQVALITITSSDHEQAILMMQRLECELDQNTSTIHLHGRYGFYAKPKRFHDGSREEDFARVFLRALRATLSAQQYAGIGVFGCVHLRRSLNDRITRCDQNASIVAWRDAWQQDSGVAVLGHTHGVYRSRPTERNPVDITPIMTSALDTSTSPPLSARRNADLQFEMGGVGLELCLEHILQLLQRYGSRWLRKRKQRVQSARAGRARSDSGATLLRKLSRLSVSLRLRNIKLDLIGEQDQVRLEASELELFLDRSRAAPKEGQASHSLPESRPIAKSLHTRLEQCSAFLLHSDHSRMDSKGIPPTMSAEFTCGGIYGSLEEATLQKVNVRVGEHPFLQIGQVDVARVHRQVRLNAPFLNWCPDVHDMLLDLRNRWRVLLPLLIEIPDASPVASTKSPESATESTTCPWQLYIQGEASAWGRFPQGNNSGVIFSDLEVSLCRPWRPRVERLSWFVDDRVMGHAAQVCFWIHWTKEKRSIEAHAHFLRFQMPYGFRFVQQYNLFLAHLRLYFRYQKTHRRQASAGDTMQQSPSLSTGPTGDTMETANKSIFPNLDIRADHVEFVLCDHELERWYNQRWLFMVDECIERALRERLAQSSVGNRRNLKEHLTEELARQHAQLYVQRLRKWQEQERQHATRPRDFSAGWPPDTVDQQLFVASASNVRFRLLRSNLSRAEENAEAAAFAVRMDAALGAVSQSRPVWQPPQGEAFPATRERDNLSATAPTASVNPSSSTATANNEDSVNGDNAAIAPELLDTRLRLLDPTQWYALGRRRLVVDINGPLTVHIRHFPFPVLQWSQGLHLQGTVALGELLVSEPYVAERDLQLSEQLWVRYRRAISPNRWYCDWKLSCRGLVHLTWSRALMSSLKDVMDGFQGFAGAGKDPSPLLNWWNQLRVLVHGRWQLHCPEGILFTFLSSVPYDPDHDERLEWHLQGPQTALIVDRRLGVIHLEANAWEMRLRLAANASPDDDAVLNKLSGAEPIQLTLRVEATPAVGRAVTSYVHPLGQAGSHTSDGDQQPAVRSTLVPVAAPKQHVSETETHPSSELTREERQRTARAVPYAAWHTSLAADPQHDTYRAFRAQAFSFQLQCQLSWDHADAGSGGQLSTYALAVLLFRALELAGANRLLGQSPYAYRPVSRKIGIQRSGKRRYSVRFPELIQAFTLVLTLPKAWSIRCRDALRPAEWFRLGAGAVDATLRWQRAPGSAFESIPGRSFEQHIRISAQSLRIDLNQGPLLQTAGIRYEQALEVERMQGLLTPHSLETLRLWPDAFTAVFVTAKKASQRALFDVQDPLRPLYREVWSRQPRSTAATMESNAPGNVSRTAGASTWQPGTAAPSSSSVNNNNNSTTQNAQNQRHELGNRARRIANALGMPLSMQRKPDTDALDLRDLLLQEHFDQVKQQQQQQQQRSSSGIGGGSSTEAWHAPGTRAETQSPHLHSTESPKPRRRTRSFDQKQIGRYPMAGAASDAHAPPTRHTEVSSQRPRATSVIDPRSELVTNEEPPSTWPSWSPRKDAVPPGNVAMPRVPETADVGLTDAGSGRARYTQRRQLLSQRVRFQLTLIEPSVWIRNRHGRDAVLLSAHQGILDVVECVCHRGASDLGTEMDYRVCLLGVNIAVEGQHLSQPEESAPIYLYYIHPIPAEDLRARHIEVAVPALYLAATAAEFHTLFRIVREVLLSKSSQALRVSSILKPLRQRAVVFDDADFVIERALTLRALLQNVDLLLLHGGVDSLAMLWTYLEGPPSHRNVPREQVSDPLVPAADRRPVSNAIPIRTASRATFATDPHSSTDTETSTTLHPRALQQRRAQAFAFRWWLAAQARAWQVLLVDALRGRIHHEDRSITLADELEDLDIILEMARVRWCLLLSRRRVFLELSIQRIYGLQRRYMSGRELNDYGITDLVVRNRAHDLDLDSVIRGDSFRYVSVSEGTIGGVMRYSRLTLDMAKTIHIRLYGVLVDRLYEYFFGEAANGVIAASSKPVAGASQARTRGSLPTDTGDDTGDLREQPWGPDATPSTSERLGESSTSQRSTNQQRSGFPGSDWPTMEAMAEQDRTKLPVTDACGPAAGVENESPSRYPDWMEKAENRPPTGGEPRTNPRHTRPATSSKSAITPVQIDYAYLSSLEIIGSYHSGTGKEHSFLDFDDLCVLVPSLMYQAVTGSWQAFIEMVRRDFASAFVRDAIGQLSKRKFLGFLRRPVLAPATSESTRQAAASTGPVALVASPAATDAAIRRRRQRGRTPIVQAVERASAAAAVRSTAREHLSELVLFGSLRLVRRALMRDTTSTTREMPPESDEQQSVVSREAE